MRTLVSLEFNKMIRKKSFYICLILVFCYGVMSYHNQVDPLGLGSGSSTPWGGTLQSLIASMFALNLFVIIAVSPLFCEEHTFQMNAFLFTSKYGRKKCFMAKITAAYLMGLAVSLVMILLHILATLAFFGKEGLSCSIQMSDPALFQFFVDSKSVGSALFDAAALYMADILVTISLTVFASVLTSQVLTGTILSFVFFVSPHFFMMPFKIPQIRLIMAAMHMTSFEDILYLPDLTVGPVSIQYSYVIVVILLLIAVGFTACAYKTYQAIPEEGITWLEN